MLKPLRETFYIQFCYTDEMWADSLGRDYINAMPRERIDRTLAHAGYMRVGPIVWVEQERDSLLDPTWHTGQNYWRCYARAVLNVTGKRSAPLPFSGLEAAFQHSRDIQQCVWAQLTYRKDGVYQIYPGGRNVFYPNPPIIRHAGIRSNNQE